MLCNIKGLAGMPERPNGHGLGPCGLVPSWVRNARNRANVLLPALFFFSLKEKKCAKKEKAKGCCDSKR